VKRNAIYYFLFTLGIMSSAFSYQQNAGLYDKNLGRKTEIKKIDTDQEETKQMIQGYNKPARIDVKGHWEFNVNVSFLYRYAVQKGLEIGQRYSREIFPNGDFAYSDGHIKMDFDYHPAFRIGAGMNSTYDDWDINFYYTRFHSTDRKSEATDPDLAWGLNYDYIEPTWFIYALLSPHTLRGIYSKGIWKLKTDIFDFELGRFACVGKKISVRPFVCFRAGRIDQKYYNEFIGIRANDDEHTIVVNNKSDSWLVGPRGGFDTKWCLGKGFSLIGNASATLFYQKFKINIFQEFLSSPVYPYNNTYVAKLKEHFINTNFEVSLALKWGKYFFNNKIFWDLLLGYDFVIFMNQNMIRSFWNNVQTLGLLSAQHAHDDGNPNNLMFHGLVVTTKLDF